MQFAVEPLLTEETIAVDGASIKSWADSSYPY
jgi:hypothetical protein